MQNKTKPVNKANLVWVRLTFLSLFFSLSIFLFWVLCAQSELDLRRTSSKVPQGEDQDAQKIPTEAEVLHLIATNYLRQTAPPSKDDLDDFLEYMKQMRLVVTGINTGSVIIIIKCASLEILEGLWVHYKNGYLNEVAQKFFRTADIIREFGEVKFTVSILEEEYRACRAFFLPLSGKLKLCCNVFSSKITVNNETV